MLPAAGIHYISLFTSRKETGFYSKFFVVFHAFLKVSIAGPSSKSSIGMENNNELYHGFSAVKVKLVGSLI